METLLLMVVRAVTQPLTPLLSVTEERELYLLTVLHLTLRPVALVALQVAELITIRVVQVAQL